jgi:hypothetical protein
MYLRRGSMIKYSNHRVRFWLLILSHYLIGMQGDLENALLLKNKIESAKPADLFSNGNLIDQHCEQIEQIIRYSCLIELTCMNDI